jgi:hypothetical protein
MDSNPAICGRRMAALQRGLYELERYGTVDRAELAKAFGQAEEDLFNPHDAHELWNDFTADMHEAKWMHRLFGVFLVRYIACIDIDRTHTISMERDCGKWLVRRRGGLSHLFLLRSTDGLDRRRKEPRSRARRNGASRVVGRAARLPCRRERDSG